MNEQSQIWNIVLGVCYKKHGKYMEFNVESKTLLGATMKANKTLKALNENDQTEDWKIIQVYWLHTAPNQKEV